MKFKSSLSTIASTAFFLIGSLAFSQIGTRFPSEKKVVVDPITGQELLFLTTKQAGDSKTYPTHPQWTSDGEWLVFRSNRVKGEAMAVNEKSGAIVQVTEGGYNGTLCIAQKSMKLYFMRQVNEKGMQLIEVDLATIDIGQSIHLSEIKMPEGVEFVQLAHGNDAAVASVAKPRAMVEEVEAKPAEGAADAAAPAADGAKASDAAPAEDAKSDKAK